MRSPRKLILQNNQAPGDTLMLTAAVLGLHRCHPRKFITDVRTPSPDLWRHNPYITPLRENDPEVERLVCHYPLVHRCNELPVHFLHGFTAYLSEQLGVPITPQAFKGDVHLSAEEKAEEPLVHRLTGDTSPYWIVVAGGKLDFTIKWWAPERYQAVVDHFAGRLRFVQVGAAGHHHPPLREPARGDLLLVHQPKHDRSPSGEPPPVLTITGTFPERAAG